MVLGSWGGGVEFLVMATREVL
uniref:Uncharacterized protein n=1 Tax=Anguilla anguilla TaxID=7936 RepID=A0A0E9QAP7_ANGAN